MDLNIETFNPAAAECYALAAATKDIIEVDLKDKEQLEKVKRARIDLGKMRTAITKKGKEMREEAVGFQKEVIKREKELIEIIEPEEKRLKAFEEKAEELKERERRVATLPYRRAKLNEIGYTMLVTDEELLDMHEAAFFAYTNRIVEIKNAAEREALAQERAKLDAEKAEEERLKGLRDAEEKGKAAAEEKIKREAQEKAEQEKKDRINTRVRLLTMRGFILQFTTNSYVNEALDFNLPKITLEDAIDEGFRAYLAEVDKKIEEVAAEKAKAAADLAEKEEREKMERQEQYQSFLRQHGYTEENKDQFIVKKEGNVVRLYKLMGQIEFITYGME